VAQEKFMKRLVGKAEVENALQRLEMLTKEENVMTAARTFEAAHHINVNVKATQELTHNIDNNMMEVKGLTYNVRADVDVIKEGTRRVHDNVNLAKHGAPIFSISSYTYRFFPVIF
jgi:hypothetical protein